MRGRRGPHHRHRARVRHRGPDGAWGVHGRVERFVEPALLLLLRERPRHGYELLEGVPELAAEERRVDLGNLYRVLRALEDEGVVTSRWEAGVPGPAKRVYELTDAGRALLDEWAAALGRTQASISAFLDRYERGEEVST
jgi:PadR family transcriptional regulator, regulatory protein PadR